MINLIIIIYVIDVMYCIDDVCFFFIRFVVRRVSSASSVLV